MIGSMTVYVYWLVAVLKTIETRKRLVLLIARTNQQRCSSYKSHQFVLFDVGVPVE